MLRSETSASDPSGTGSRTCRRRTFLGGLGGATALAAMGPRSASAAASADPTWERVALPPGVNGPSRLVEIAVHAGSVWAGGRHTVEGVQRPLVVARTDGTWRSDDLMVGWTGEVTSLAATSSSEAWAVIDSEDAGQVLLQRYDRNEWYPNWSPDEAPQRVFASGGQVWVLARAEGGQSELFRLGPTSWIRVPRPPGTVFELVARSSDDVWVASEGPVDGSATDTALLAHFDGTTWQRVPVGGGPRSAFGSLHVVSDDEVWAGGTAGFVGRPPPLPLRPLVGRWDGAAWHRVEASVDFGPVASCTGTAGGALTWVGFSRATTLTNPPGGGTSYDAGPTFARWDGTALAPHDEPLEANEQNAVDLDLATDGATTWAAGWGLDADGVETARLFRHP